MPNRGGTPTEIVQSGGASQFDVAGFDHFAEWLNKLHGEVKGEKGRLLGLH